MIELTFENLPIEFEKKALAAAEAEAIYRQLKIQEKVIFDLARNNIAEENPSFTESKLNRLARIDPLYKDHIKAQSMSHKAYLVAKAGLNAIEVKMDCMRSENSKYVAEMKLR